MSLPPARRSGSWSRCASTLASRRGSIRERQVNRDNRTRRISLMDWFTLLFSALLATLTPTHAAPPPPPQPPAHRWTVIVGGATADTSIYANAFFPKAIEIGVGDTITWQFEGFHNVAFLGGGATPPFSVQDSGKFYFNPLVVFPAGDASYDGTGFHNSGLPGPDGKLSYTLTFKK